METPEIPLDTLSVDLRKALETYPALRPIFYWNAGLERAGVSIFAIAGALGVSPRFAKRQLLSFRQTKLGQMCFDRHICYTTALPVYSLRLRWDAMDFAIPFGEAPLTWGTHSAHFEARLMRACPRRPTNKFLQNYRCPKELVPTELLREYADNGEDANWYTFYPEDTSIHDDEWKLMKKFSRNFPCDLYTPGW